MDQPGPVEPADLQGLRIDILRRAVDIYLGLAYPTDRPPETIQRRLEWPQGVDIATLLSGPPFELTGNSTGNGSPIYALRLGNARYPHMKLQVQTWPNEAGFLLSVNTHDQVTVPDPHSSDAQKFRELQASNQQVKELIEQEWDRAGLPTFLRYLLDYIKSRPETQPPPSAEPGS